jgi:hypothetical protein
MKESYLRPGRATLLPFEAVTFALQADQPTPPLCPDKIFANDRSLSPKDQGGFVTAFRKGLSEGGYVEGSGQRALANAGHDTRALQASLANNL